MAEQDGDTLPRSTAETTDVSLSQRKRLFTKELKVMLHGFGDDENPYEETVDLVDDLVVKYVQEMTQKAMDVGKQGKIHVEDIIFLIRKDPKKYARVKDLLRMNEELKKARRDLEPEKDLERGGTAIMGTLQSQ